MGQSHDIDFQTQEWVLTHHLENMMCSHEANSSIAFWRN